jgi:acyl carrier protein
MTARETLELELKELIISALALEDVRAEQIDSKAPLFGEGLGLDSIDALELVMALQRKYGFKATETAEFNRQTLASVDNLATFVEARLARA